MRPRALLYRPEHRPLVESAKAHRGGRCTGDFEYRAKIGDFGVSNVLSLTKSTDSLHGAAPGTILFMPPEVLRPPHVFSTKTDVWSLGMLLWEMWTEATPFEGLTSAAVMERILAGDLPEWPKGSPPLLRQLAARCWNMVRAAPCAHARRPQPEAAGSVLCLSPVVFFTGTSAAR